MTAWMAAAMGVRLRFVDVGQGAALLVVSPSSSVLIDSGPSGGAEAILAALEREGVDRLDLVVHTHFDADHVGGITRVVAGRDGRLGTADDVVVAEAWDRGIASLPTTAAVSAYLDVLGSLRHEPEPGRPWRAEGLELVPLRPVAPEHAGENERGLALCLTAGSDRLLVLGDLPSPSIATIADACAPADVLWVSHHGSADATAPESVRRIDPRLAVVSAGHDNRYCHPDPAALAALHGRTCFVLDAAGTAPNSGCPPIAATLGPTHHVVGSDVVVEASAEIAGGGLAVRVVSGPFSGPAATLPPR